MAGIPGDERMSAQIGAGSLAVRFYEAPDGALWREIRVIGDGSILRGPATEEDLAKYPAELESFRRGGLPAGETDLGLLGLDEDQLRDLRHGGIRSIQQVVSLSDSAIGTLPGGYALRRKAADYLETQTAAMARREVAERDIKIAELERKVAALVAAKVNGNDGKAGGA